MGLLAASATAGSQAVASLLPEQRPWLFCSYEIFIGIEMPRRISDKSRSASDSSWPLCFSIDSQPRKDYGYTPNGNSYAGLSFQRLGAWVPEGSSQLQCMQSIDPALASKRSQAVFMRLECADWYGDLDIGGKIIAPPHIFTVGIEYCSFRTENRRAEYLFNSPISAGGQGIWWYDRHALT